jgi:peptidoglycan/LPS O-acetylase OafA/YrhL
MPSSSPTSTEGRVHFFDGLRGWAAVMVLLFHTESSLLNLDFFNRGLTRLFVDGGLAVHIFFILSGAALSFGLLRATDVRPVVAAMFKRGPRLLIPMLTSCFVAYLLMKAGLMHNVDSARLQSMFSPIPEDSVYFSWYQVYYNFQPDFLGMLRFTFWDVFLVTDTLSTSASYNGPLWTMPIELGGSFVIYFFWLLMIVCQRKLATAALCGSLSALAFFAMPNPYSVGHYALLFLFGALVAQQYSRQGPLLRICSHPISQGLLLVAFFVTYQKVDPTFSATLIILLVAASPLLRRLLSARLSVFLGRISFPLYVIHMPIVCSATSWAIVSFYDPTSIGGSLAIGVGTIALALLSARLLLPVEAFSIRFAHRVAAFFVGA